MNEIVNFVIDHETNLYSRFVNLAWTPIMVAADKGNVEMMKILIKYGADINYASPNQHFEVKYIHLDLVYVIG